MQQEIQNQGTDLATLPPAQRAVIALDATATEKQLRELVAYSAGIVSVSDKDGREEAHRAGMNLKNARVAIGKVGKAARDDANAFAQAVIAEEKRLVAIVSPEEERVFALRDGYDAKVKAAKEAAERKERERVAAIRAKIDGIKGLPAASYRDSAAQLAATIADLQRYLVTTGEFAEFAEEATSVQAVALGELRALHEQAVAAEAEAARIAAERAELERQRAEAEAARRAEEERQRAERDALEAERRELEQLRAEKAAREAAALAVAVEQAKLPDGDGMVVLGTVPAGGTVANLVLPDGRKALDAARNVPVEDRPLIVTYAADNDDLAIKPDETCEDETTANFRAATRALLAFHSIERARVLFDEELQSFLAAA